MTIHRDFMPVHLCFRQFGLLGTVWAWARCPLWQVECCWHRVGTECASLLLGKGPRRCQREAENGRNYAQGHWRIFQSYEGSPRYSLSTVGRGQEGWIGRGGKDPSFKRQFQIHRTTLLLSVVAAAVAIVFPTDLVLSIMPEKITEQMLLSHFSTWMQQGPATLDNHLVQQFDFQQTSIIALGKALKRSHNPTKYLIVQCVLCQ